MKTMLNNKYLQLLFLLIVSQIKLSNGIRQVACALSERNKKCTINGLTLTSQNSSFVPLASNWSIVNNLEITGSVVPVITSDICTKFTKLNFFVAIQQYVEQIDDFAFYNCTEIKNINLEKNNIHKLGKGVFSNARQLQRLHILGASLDQIDIDLFSNLSEINQIVFGASGLKELPTAAVKNLKKLQKLYIYSNELSDLDTEGLIQNLPSLKTIYINDNNFHCDRLIEIIKSFKAKNITVHDHTFASLMKKRDYIPRRINNIICLSQAQLQSEKLKKALTNSLEELKDLPIAKEVIQLKDIVTTGFIDADTNIVALSNSLNETSDYLNEQISYLNETLQSTSTEIDDAVNDLKQNISSHIIERQILEARLNVTSAKLQELVDSVAIMMEKYNAIISNSATSSKSTENNSQAYESLGHSIVAVWVFLISLLLIIVAISVFVYKRYKKVRVNEPILCYENRSDHVGQYKEDSLLIEE